MAELRRHAGVRYLGTAAERGAMSTTSMATGTEFFESDTRDIWIWDGAAWQLIHAGSNAMTVLMIQVFS